MNLEELIQNIIEKDGEKFNELIGKKISSSQVIVNPRSKKMATCSPLILTIEGTHLEVNVGYTTTIYFTWNSINLGKRPFYWLNLDQYNEPAYWRKNWGDILPKICGQTINNILFLSSLTSKSSLENPLSVNTLFDKEPWEEVDDYCTGIQFQLSTDTLNICSYDEYLSISTGNLSQMKCWGQINAAFQL